MIESDSHSNKLFCQKLIVEQVLTCRDARPRSLRRSQSSFDKPDEKTSKSKSGRNGKLRRYKSMTVRDHHDSDSGIEDSPIEQHEEQFTAIIDETDVATTSRSESEASDQDDECFEFADGTSSSLVMTPRHCVTPVMMSESLNDLSEYVALAAKIPDNLKKDFCPSTAEAFHAEFARLILVPTLQLGANYRLIPYEVVPVEQSNICYDFVKLDNAKAQFKCYCCGHAWTSMRARIAFHVTNPYTGIILLQVFGQQCANCEKFVEPLWYVDEVCHVVKSLAKEIFRVYYHEYYDQLLHFSGINNHDCRQRKGTMKATHLESLCSACRLGICFPKIVRPEYCI